MNFGVIELVVNSFSSLGIVFEAMGLFALEGINEFVKKCFILVGGKFSLFSSVSFLVLEQGEISSKNIFLFLLFFLWRYNSISWESLSLILNISFFVI